MARERWPAGQAAHPDFEKRGNLWLRTSLTLQSCLTTFRRVVGMPDYSAYLEHLAQRHPDWPVPSEQEFFQVYIETRYGGGVSRCC